MKIIKPCNTQAIQELEIDEIAFPDIDYTVSKPLNLPSTTLQAAYTTIKRRVDEDYLKGLDWDEDGGIEWQNEKLEELSENIYQMIQQFSATTDNSLLIKIFIWIQLWGGNSGRSIFVRGDNWPDNFCLETYREAINQIRGKGDYPFALEILNRMVGLSTAFSTKHIHFWSGANAPIYDSVIASIVFGRSQSQVRSKQYPFYISWLDNLKK